VTLNQLKYFIAVARCLSFTEAARSLFMTQPALSRQIMAMEEELGTRLFVREKKALKLTPGGSVLYNGLPEFLRQYEDLMNDARHANRGHEGRLRLGILDVYDASELLAAVLGKFQRDYPQISLSMERYSLGELPELLYENRLDIVCTYGFSLFDKPDLMTVNVQKFDSCIMLNRNHPLANKPDLTLEDLRQERFVQLGSEASVEGYQYISNLIGRGGISPEVLYVDKNEDVLLWVELGNGVAVTSDRTIEKHNPRVVIRELNIPEVKGHDVTMAWRRSNYNPAIALFMELMEGHR
jgi:DNA-binding transcriptional LysR family regulator